MQKFSPTDKLLPEELADIEIVIRALSSAAACYLYSKNLDEGFRLAQESVKLAENFNIQNVFACYTVYSWALYAHCDYKRAFAMLQKTNVDVQQIDEPKLPDIEDLQIEIKKALVYYQNIIEHLHQEEQQARQTGNIAGAVVALIKRAKCLTSLGEVTNGLETLRQARELSNQPHLKDSQEEVKSAARGGCDWLISKAIKWENLRDFQTAREFYEAAERIATEHHNQYALANAKYQYAYFIATKLREPQDALGLAQEAEAIARTGAQSDLQTTIAQFISAIHKDLDNS